MMTLPYKDQAAGKKEQVAAMFDNISGQYDFLNHFLSLGIDKSWRKRTIELLRERRVNSILDVATGTGDFAIEALRLNPDKVIGVDISEGMLEIGKKKLKERGLDHKIALQYGDSEQLPFEEQTFDIITVGFGVRNFEDLSRGLKEMRRVLKDGGVAAILEFSKPRSFPVKQLYGFYFRHLLPTVGRWISKDKRAYSYLPESVQAFPDGKDFVDVLFKCGYSQVKAYRLFFGVASIYLAEK